jgi:hypothetical protein
MHSFEFKEKVELSDCIFVSKFILTINSTEKEIYLLQASNNNSNSRQDKKQCIINRIEF